MKTPDRLAMLLGIATLLGCAESPPPIVVAPVREPQEAPDVPTYCASSAKPCVLQTDFVDQLCKDRYASVAPYLFQRHTPFVRLHANSRNIELRNSRGGPTGTQPIAFAEELLLLFVTTTPAEKPKKPDEEIYDVLRWDGTCATIPKSDVVTYLPGVPQAALVDFNELDTTMRAALLRDKKVGKLHEAREATCHAGSSSESCVKATKTLSETIVAAIRLGLRVPMPRKRPGGASARPVPAQTPAVHLTK